MIGSLLNALATIIDGGVQKETMRAAETVEWANTQKAVAGQLNEAERFLSRLDDQHRKDLPLTGQERRVLMHMARLSIELRAEKYGLKKEFDT
jgi:hypothetical protein